MNVKEKYLIVQLVTKVNASKIIEQRIEPVDEFPYVMDKDEAIEILENSNDSYLAVPVLIKLN